MLGSYDYHDKALKAIQKPVQDLLDAERAYTVKLHKALSDLVQVYVANRGTKYEFISCITPPNNMHMTPKQRAENKYWQLWDAAREVLALTPVVSMAEDLEKEKA